LQDLQAKVELNNIKEMIEKMGKLKKLYLVKQEELVNLKDEMAQELQNKSKVASKNQALQIEVESLKEMIGNLHKERQ